MRRIPLSAWFIFLALCCVAPVLAQDPPETQTPPTEPAQPAPDAEEPPAPQTQAQPSLADDVADLITRLRSGDPLEMFQAARELRRLPAEALPFLREARDTAEANGEAVLAARLTQAIELIVSRGVPQEEDGPATPRLPAPLRVTGAVSMMTSDAEGSFTASVDSNGYVRVTANWRGREPAVETREFADWETFGREWPEVAARFPVPPQLRITPRLPGSGEEDPDPDDLPGRLPLPPGFEGRIPLPLPGQGTDENNPTPVMPGTREAMLEQLEALREQLEGQGLDPAEVDALIRRLRALTESLERQDSPEWPGEDSFRDEEEDQARREGLALGGVYLTAIPDERRGSLELSEDQQGLFVDRVINSTDFLSAAGVQEDDVLVSLAGIPLLELADLPSLLESLPSGEPLLLEVIRESERVELMVIRQ